ncbi:hypothetical protein LX36DRAFT_422478 [Colletotrichum falcatum]|nr:hypothetical protein LX36DRAFT_422478 [Colletotrichum falcatum]
MGQRSSSRFPSYNTISHFLRIVKHDQRPATCRSRHDCLNPPNGSLRPFRLPFSPIFLFFFLLPAPTLFPTLFHSSYTAATSSHLSRLGGCLSLTQLSITQHQTRPAHQTTLGQNHNFTPRPPH